MYFNMHKIKHSATIESAYVGAFEPAIIAAYESAHLSAHIAALESAIITAYEAAHISAYRLFMSLRTYENLSP